MKQMLHVINIRHEYITGQYSLHRLVFLKFSKDKRYVEFENSFAAVFSNMFKWFFQFSLSNSESVYYYPISRSSKGLLRDILLLSPLLIFKKPLVFHVHGAEIGHSKHVFRDTLFKFLFGLSKHCIFITRASVPTWLKNQRSKKYSIISNFVDGVTIIKKSSCEVRRRQICFFSNYIPGKGASQFIELARIFNEDSKFKEWSFIMNGAFPSRSVEAELRQKAKGLENLSIGGPISNDSIHSKLAESEILLFPSAYKTECQPLIVIEALISGCLVVGYDINNALSEIENENIVIAQNFDGMKTSLFELCQKLTETSHSSIDRNSNQNQAVERFSFKRFEKEFMDVLEQ